MHDGSPSSSPPPPPAHDVLRVVGERARSGSQPGQRDDGYRVALAIEGGGMRGTVSAGMALALDELGLVPAFDAVYGASAGAITGAWLLSRPAGLRGWTEPAYARAFIRRSGPLRGRPVADVRSLIEDLYQTRFPMDFAAVLASPVEFHPLATDAATGQSTDLRPLTATPAELRLALRASAALPLLAGPPVALDGRRFYDAGLSESVPYRTALDQGATHVLVLRSRRDPLTVPDDRAPARDPLTVPDDRVPARDPITVPDDRVPARGRPGRASAAQPPARSLRLLARTTLRRESPALRAVFLARDTRRTADNQRLAGYQSALRTPLTTPIPSAPSTPSAPSVPSAPPVPSGGSEAGAQVAVYSIRPPAGSPIVSRLATDGRLLRGAFESGRAATHATFAS
jgi:predicted acylesterase/phospholipase RssA